MTAADLFRVQKLRHFDASEWGRPDELERVDARLLHALDEYREHLGRPLHPSPAPGAWARGEGSPGSRHYAVGRLADAGDLFPEAPLRTAWRVAVQSRLFGGIGLYVDTHFRGVRWPMLHLDLREERIWWARVEGRYVYPQQEGEAEDEFFRLLAQAAGVVAGEL